MAKFNLPEDEEQEDQFATSPIPYEQVSMTTDTPDFMDQLPRVEKEVSKADEIETESLDLLNKIPAEQEQSIPKSQELSNLLQRNLELKRLQDERREKINNLAYLSAANKISQGIARGQGGVIDDNESGVKALRDAAGLPIEDYNLRQKDEAVQMELGNERDMNDPNSDISKFSQQRAVAIGTKMGMNPEEVQKLTKMTAKQLEKLGFSSSSSLMRPRVFDKNIVNPNTKKIESLLVDEQGNVIKNLGETGYSYGSGIDPVTGLRQIISKSNPTLAPIIQGEQPDVSQLKPEEITRAKLNPKQKELLDKTRDDLSKNKQYTASQEAVDGADNALALLESGKTSGQDLVRAIQTMLAKSSGQVGILTEQDVAGFNGRADAISRLERAISTTLQGKLPEGDRKFLMSYATAMQNAAKRNIDQINYIYAKQLSDDVGLDLRQASKLLTTDERLDPKSLSKETGKSDKSKKTELSEEDKKAIAWAKKNPDDPRSKQILQMHGK